MKTPQDYQNRATVLKALAHPTRILIADVLGSGEQCVQDLTQRVGHDISTVSKHLSVMKNAGLIGAQKRGASVFYHLRCNCLKDFFRCIDAMVSPALDCRDAGTCAPSPAQS